MLREQVIDRLWQDSTLFLSRADFGLLFDGWEIETIDGPNGVAIVVCSKGPEFHFAKLDPTVQITRELLRRWPGQIIARHGYALTRTPKEDARQLRFNRRLGFEVTHQDEHDVHQRITHLRVKDTPCQ